MYFSNYNTYLILTFGFHTCIIQMKGHPQSYFELFMHVFLISAVSYKQKLQHVEYIIPPVGVTFANIYFTNFPFYAEEIPNTPKALGTFSNMSFTWLVRMSVAVFPQVKGIGGLPTALLFQCGIVFSCGIYIFMTQNIRYQIDIPGFFIEFGTVGTA